MEDRIPTYFSPFSSANCAGIRSMSHVAEIRLTINRDCARKLLTCVFMCVCLVFNRDILRVKISLSVATASIGA